MPVTPQPTKTDLQNQVNQIVTGGNYTANQLRPLLTNLLDGIYSPFFSASSNPGSGNNQTQTYKAGSLGRNTSTGRYFVCSAADGTTATWDQLTSDRGYQAISASASSTQTISNNTDVLVYSGSQNGVTLNMPTIANSYTGKRIKIFFSSPASNIGTGVTIQIPGSPATTLLAAATYTANSIVEFMSNGSTWVITQYSIAVPDVSLQKVTIVNNGTATMSKNTSHLLLNGSSIGRYTVTLPTEAYVGKVVSIFTSATAAVTTAIEFRNPVTSAIVRSTTIAVNISIQFIYEGSDSWLYLGPSI
jgi:hypothetical protein